MQLGASKDTLLIHVPTGGLRHRKLVDPQGAAELVRSAPAQAFALALLDSPKPMSSRDLIARLENDFDVDASELWKAARADLEADGHVKRSGKGPSLKYVWVGEPDPYFASDEALEQESQNHAQIESQGSLGSEPLEESAQPRDDSPTGPELADGAKPAGDPALGDDSSASREAPNPAVALVRSASQSGQLPENWTRLLTQALRSPLAAGLALEALPEDALRAAAPVLDRGRLILLAVPRSSKAIKSIDAAALAGADAARALLEAAKVELSAAESGSPSARELQRAHLYLARRILASPSVALVGLDTVLRAARDLEAPGEGPRETAWIAEALAAVINSLTPDAWRDLSLHDKSAIARRLAPAALRPNSPRARVLTWLWRNHPVDLAEDVWWRKVDFEDLAGVATTPLGSALESQAIAESVVRPVVDARVESATTRRQLFAALSAPAPLARLIDPDAVQRAFERVLRNDDIARAWLVRLRNEARITELLRQVDALTHRAEESDARAASDREAAQAAQDRLLRVEARLAEAAASTNDLRESQSRQIKIDAMRALAGLCAYVDGAVGSQSPERIRRRVRQMAVREGLVPFGTPGTTEPYDPRRHDVVGDAPQPGTPVTVTGIGYTWGEGADEIVLVRALAERFR